MDWNSIIAIVASLVLIGFFAGIEIAFVSVNKLSIELRKKQGSYPGRTWAAFHGKSIPVYWHYSHSVKYFNGNIWFALEQHTKQCVEILGHYQSFCKA